MTLLVVFFLFVSFIFVSASKYIFGYILRKYAFLGN